MIRNELAKLQRSFPDSSYSSSANLTPEKVTVDLLDEGRQYVERVRKLNNNKRVPYFEGKIKVIEDRLKSAGSDEFTIFKEKYVNNKLSEFVKNSTETDRIIEYNGEFFQKMEPIFRDPEPKFIKAHFYSPTKQVFGYYIDTFTVNVIVLWVMTILMYLALYFRLLKKLLDAGEMIMGNGSKGD